MNLKCLLVDDEPLARAGMEEYVRSVPFLELSGVCADALQAQERLKQEPIDLLLLDVEMPHMTGIEFLKSLKNPPMAILTTAFSEYALEGFELDVIDFLVKPIPYERFLKAVTKARDLREFRLAPAGSTTLAPAYTFVKSNGKMERVYFEDILFVEAMQNYVIIHESSHRLILYMTLAAMEQQLPADRFMRVHKSFLVALGRVNTIDGHDLVIGSHRIPVSRTLREEVSRRIIGKDRLSR